jgi:hypothetical protein
MTDDIQWLPGHAPATIPAAPAPPAIAPPAPAADTCHHCGAPAETHWLRHATSAEYAAISETLRPIDGRATIPVHACGDHHLQPFCAHTQPAAQPCPTCHAAPGDPCTKPDGTDRPVPHPDRTEPRFDACAHAHRPDCAGYGHCDCSQDDPPPTRTPGIPNPGPTQAERAAAINAAHAAEIDWLRKLMIQAGNDPLKAAELARTAYGEHMAQFTGAAESE